MIEDPSQRPALRVVSGDARRPANALPSERHVIGWILVDPEAIDRVADLVIAEHFFNAINRRAYGAAFDLHARQQPVGLLEIGALLRERSEYGADVDKWLKELAHEYDGSPSDALEHHARLVRDKYRLRRLAEETTRIAGETFGPIENTQEFLDLAEAVVYELAKPPESATAAYVGETLREILLKLQTGGNALGLTTGFDALDKITTGWHGAELSLLAGRPGSGKTACAMAMAVQAARAPVPDGALPNGALVFSLEMSREQLVSRTICAEARVELQRMRFGTLQPTDYSALTEAGQWFSKLPIIVDDKPGLNPIELRAKARRTQIDWQREGKKRLALIVVDYLQLMQARHLVARNANREQEINYIAESLKNLSKELNVPVVALCQLNRGLEARKDKRPMLSDLRESGALENHADVVVFVHREEYYMQDKTPEDKKGLAELIVAKQRNGPTKTAHVQFTGKYTAFGQLAPGWEPPEPEDD